MTRRIAVEGGLTNVVRALRSRGFETTKLTGDTMNNVAAVVVTGMSENFMGMQDTRGNRIPVIDASGMTADEVVDLVESRSALQE